MDELSEELGLRDELIDVLAEELGESLIDELVLELIDELGLTEELADELGLTDELMDELKLELALRLELAEELTEELGLTDELIEELSEELGDELGESLIKLYVIVTVSSEYSAQGQSLQSREILQRKTFAPSPSPVTTVLYFLRLLNVPAPETTVHLPQPITG